MVYRFFLYIHCTLYKIFDLLNSTTNGSINIFSRPIVYYMYIVVVQVIPVTSVAISSSASYLVLIAPLPKFSKVFE